MEAPGTELAVLILAAGEGTRMRSDLAKVLHEIGGRPMLGYPLAVAEALEPKHLVVVIGCDAEQVEERFRGRAHFALQSERRGTGHAALQALPFLSGFSGEVLILYGDTPLLRAETIRRMRALKAERRADLVLLTARSLLALPAFLQHLSGAASATRIHGYVALTSVLCFAYAVLAVAPPLAVYHSRNFADGNRRLFRAAGRTERERG